VFNPLPWKRSGVVDVDGKPRFVQDVPAGGYLTLPSPGAAERQEKQDDRTLENDHFRLVLSPDRAAVSSVTDKHSGKELVAKNAEFGLGEYLYQQFSRADTDRFRDTYTRNRNAGFGKNWLPASVLHIDARPQGTVWTITRGAEADVAEGRSPAGNGVPHASRLRVTLYHHQPVIDLAVAIEDKPITTRPEAGWICLPFAVDAPSFRLGRPGGIADPANDFVRGSNRHLLSLNTGMTVTGSNGEGVGLCSPDSPVVSLDKPGCWEFSRDFVPTRANVFVHLFNNMWSTNFRLWNGGTWTAKVRLWAVSSKDPADSLVTPSLETRSPLLAATVDAPAGSLPASAPGVGVSRTGVPVTAFGPNPDGPGTLLRVWEKAGRGGEITFTVPVKYRQALPVDLRGVKIGAPLPITGGSFSTELPAFAPASFLLAP
ncbi:MAG TPA: hypothetical protein VF258_01980, partial [Luteolibacter sp.]